MKKHSFLYSVARSIAQEAYEDISTEEIYQILIQYLPLTFPIENLDDEIKLEFIIKNWEKLDIKNLESIL